MTYELQVERRALRELDALPDAAYQQIEKAIDGLAHQPRPRGTRKVRGFDFVWRLRVGRYRIIYGVFDKERLVRIIAIAARREDTYDL